VIGAGVGAGSLLTPITAPVEMQPDRGERRSNASDSIFY